MTPTEAEKDAIVAAYLEGKSLMEAAALFGYSQTVTLSALKRRGLKPRRKGAPREYSLREDFFQVLDSEEKAYWLGFLAADGYICPKPPRVVLGLQERDRAHVELLAQTLGYARPLTSHVAPAGMVGKYKRAAALSCRLTICSARMVADLGSHGITTAKSFTVEAWDGPRHLLRHYWRGVVDGDGWISRNSCNGLWKIGLVGSQAMVEAFATFARELTGTRALPVQVGNIWRLDLTGRCIPRQIAAELYSDCTVALERKLALAQVLVATPEGNQQGAHNLKRHVSNEQLRAEYEGGSNCVLLGAKYGLHPSTVMDKVRRAGGQALRGKLATVNP